MVKLIPFLGSRLGFILYNHTAKSLSSYFQSHSLHNDYSSVLHLIDTRIVNPNFKRSVVSLSPYNLTPSVWYSSGAYRKRVNRRLRLANKPVLDQAQFDQLVSQLPARFTADDLYNVMFAEPDPLVCLELFNWASKKPRFKHSVNTYHVIVQKLGICGMLEEMYDVVDQLLVVDDFGSEPLFNTIIQYLTQSRKLSRAITVFKHMKKVKNLESRPSIRTYNLLFAALLSRRIDTHINYMYMDTMECLFRQLVSDRIEPDLFCLNSMINGYVLSNHVNDGLKMFHQMGVVYNCKPEGFTYDLLIHGLCAQARTNNARDLFSQMKEKGFVASAKTYNSLVSALAIGGEVGEAVRYLREMMEKQRQADFITYKTVVEELNRKGRDIEALKLLNELKEKRFVDRVAYEQLSQVLKINFGGVRNFSARKLRSLSL